MHSPLSYCLTFKVDKEKMAKPNNFMKKLSLGII